MRPALPMDLLPLIQRVRSRLSPTLEVMAARTLPHTRGLANDETRTFLAFAIIGFASATIAPIVHAAAYLIIPFPRALVVLIETLPAIGVKLLLPHVLHLVPLWVRPVAIAFGWLVACVAIDNIPPNVHPPVRILLTLLAAAATSACEVTSLALLRKYGKLGLSGWGTGTGAGAIMVAVMPYVLTYQRGLFLRSSVGYTYYLIVAMLVACFVILPQPQTSGNGPDDRNKMDADDDMEDSSLFVQDPISYNMSFQQRLERNLRLTGSLVSPYMAPLLLAMSVQAVIFPGITRALGVSSSFEVYASYYARYGLFFHLGNLLGRASIAVVRFQKTKPLLTRLGLVAGLMLFAAALLFLSIPIIMFSVVFTVGLLCGSIYSNVFASAMEEVGTGAATDREFSLGVVGAGETGGLLVGGVFGALLEPGLCGLGGQRWCHLVK